MWQVANDVCIMSAIDLHNVVYIKMTIAYMGGYFTPDKLILFDPIQKQTI